MRTLILNFKNYGEILGEGTLKLSLIADKVSKEVREEIILAPPTPFIAHVASRVSIQVFAQGTNDASEGQSTGAVIAQAVKAAGAAGVILNHSEARLPPQALAKIANDAKKNGLRLCICVRDASEIPAVLNLDPDYLAVEPPELIGTSRSVSKENPKLVSGSLAIARNLDFGGRFLCGAGISTADDVRAAIKLGADGVLLSSSLVKAKNWQSKLRELAVALGD